MAQLKDTVVAGSLRATDMIYTNTGITTTGTVQTNIAKVNQIQAFTDINCTAFGPGTTGQILKSTGTAIYWGEDAGVEILNLLEDGIEQETEEL